MDSKRKRVVLIVHTNSYFTGLLPLAVMLNHSVDFEPMILFMGYYPTLQKDLKECVHHSIQTRITGEVSRVLVFNNGNPEQWPLKRTGLINRLKRFFRYLRAPRYLVDVLMARMMTGSILGEFFRLVLVIFSIRIFIRKEKVTLLILPADNRYNQSAVVKAAHLERKGVVVIPQFMASHLEWAEYVWDQTPYQMQGIINKLAGKIYPRWILNYKNRKLLAQPGVQILAREWLGIAPPLPWVLHSGSADAIAVESAAVRQYCLNEGLPTNVLFVTGSVSLDVIFNVSNDRRRKRTELFRLIGEKEERPILLSALPPDSIYMGRPECDFQIYDDLVEFWCRSISSVKGYLHIVSLHPSVTYEDMKYLEKYGLKISPLPTMEVIALSDIFVASISSTIQWAIACGIPVLNYDVYRYRYTDYQSLGGVTTVEEKHEFLRQLELIISNGWLKKMISAQNEIAADWGQLDGKAGVRLQELFINIINRLAHKDSNA